MRSLPMAGEIPLYDGDMERDLRTVSENQLAEKITGGLSITQKMPCPSWGIPATRCRVGTVLAQREGTTCHDCYALKGRYKFRNVQQRLETRYRGLFHPLWTPSMVFLVRWYADRYFRWFDSGDLQGENHLRNVVRIATETLQVCHWLPTREAETVRAVGEFPKNLTVRLSGTMIDGKPPTWPTTSVVTTEGMDGAYDCPARRQGNSCGKCRACWDQDVRCVAYRRH